MPYFTSFLSKTWRLSFRIKPLGVVHDRYYANILHVVNKQNPFITGVWFPEGTSNICTTIYDFKDGTYCFNRQPEIPLHKFSTITMQQIQIGKRYHFQLYINANREHDYVIKQPKSFQNVTFYASHPKIWNPANAIISDFKIDDNYSGN